MVTYVEVRPTSGAVADGTTDASMIARRVDALLPAKKGVRAIQAPAGGALVLTDAGESFRRTYTVAGLHEVGVLAVCSAVDGEGKTTISLGLARTLAEDFPELRVVLVETNLPRPRLATELGVEEHPGLVEHLSGLATLDLTYRPTDLPNLSVMPVGGAPGARGRPLRSHRLAGTILALRREFDVVILDVVSLLTNSDGVALTDLADAVVLVVRAGVTPVDLVTGAIGLIDSTRLRGVILNGVEPAAPRWLRRLLGRR